jgi:thioredoxin reductase (NADPH)
MTNLQPPEPTLNPSEQVFPTLTPAQIERVAAHGRMRAFEENDILLNAGEMAERFFVVISGRLEVVRPFRESERLVAIHHPGQFTGETNMLSGRPSFVRIRAMEAGQAIELDRQQLMALVQTDSELSEILMRAFIMRRVEIVAQGFGDAVLIGSTHSPGTLRIKEFLTRNNHP